MGRRNECGIPCIPTSRAGGGPDTLASRPQGPAHCWHIQVLDSDVPILLDFTSL